MKALNYLRSRFDFAIKGNGTIKVNQNDIEALNKLIELENSQKKNEDLEDSLLLFYILGVYKVHNEKNKVKLRELAPSEIKFPLGLPEVNSILSRLSKLIDPKEAIFQMIAQELWIYQEYERIPKDKNLYLNEIEEGMEKWGKDVIVTKQEKIPIPKEERILFEDVKMLLNSELKKAKETFPMFKALHTRNIKFIVHDRANSVQ
jgi:hypothetical protein